MPNTQLESNQQSIALRREVGVIGATMMGLGSIVGTGIFVSISDAANVAGSSLLLAIVVAAGVACLNGLSSAQLAAAHPVSGGTYEYGYRWLHPVLGFTAGWMFLCAKSASAATAALGFASYSLQFIGDDDLNLQVPVALAAVMMLTAVLLSGMRWNSLVNGVVVSVTLVTLIVFVAAGLVTWLNMSNSESNSMLPSSTKVPTTFSGFLEACALMFVAYTGYGRIATLGEEVRDPKKNIPRAIIVTLVLSMVLYISVAWVSIATVGFELHSGSIGTEAAPLEWIARHFDFPETSYVIAVGAITALFGVLINLILGLSRVVLAMARRGDLPRVLSRVDSRGRTPFASVISVGILIATLVLIGDIKITWSFSAFSVLIYYAITNLAAFKMSDTERRYPRFIALLGLLSCLFLAFWVDRTIWLFGLFLIAVGIGWWRFAKGWIVA